MPNLKIQPKIDKLKKIEYQLLKDYDPSIFTEKYKIILAQNLLNGIIDENDEIVDVEMPTSLFGVAIDWSAGDVNDTTFKLTIGDYSVEQTAGQELNEIVYIPSYTDAESVVLAADALTVDIGLNTNIDNITSNIILPLTGIYSTTISWSSSNLSVMSNSGVVTPLGQDMSVVMTATISKGIESTTKIFNFTVKAESFISTWDTTKTGGSSSGENSIKLPLDSGGTYNFTVNWGDGTSNIITSYDQAEATHIYTTGGVKTITINGQCNGFGFGYDSGQQVKDSVKIISISSWGGVTLLDDHYGHFANCSNLISVGNLNPIYLTKMKYMFGGCVLFNQDISSWDVSNVTDMSGMFQSAYAFNQPLNNWDVGSVTNMSMMFNGAQAFNQPLNNWDVSNVTNMNGMFQSAYAFNQDIGSWNISKVNMSDVHYFAEYLSPTNYDSLLNGWATLDAGETKIPTGLFLKTKYCKYTPAGSSARDTLINTYGWTIVDQGLLSTELFSSTWDTTKTGGSSSGENSIKLPLDYSGHYDFIVNWGDGSSNTITSYNQPEITHIYSTGGEYTITIDGICIKFGFGFGDLDAFKLLSISTWGNTIIDPVNYRSFMYCTNLTSVGNLDVSGFTSGWYMFSGCTSFNQDISHWNISNFKYTNNMFSGCTSFNQNLASWDISSLHSGFSAAMFENTALSTTNYDAILNGWSTLDVGETKIPTSVYIGFGTTKYSSAGQAARDTLINTYGWTIIDGGLQS